MPVGVIVVAHQTAASEELIAAMKRRAERSPVRFTLVVPCRGSGTQAKHAARRVLDEALERMREAGLEVDGHIGDSDPVMAVHDSWDAFRHGEVIVSTLPDESSRWVRMDLPHRIERLTDAPVTHVVSQPPRELDTAPPPEHEHYGVLTPLAVLGWGGGGRAEHPRSAGAE